MARMTKLAVNESDVIRARESLLSFFGGLDAKRPTAWAQYGYKSHLTFDDFKQAYERGGAAHGAVHRLLDGCWQKLPRIKQPKADKETAWETKVAKAIKAINGWQKLRDFDRRNMVGRYAALIYRMADNQPLSAPLVKATSLVDLVPVFEDQIKATKWDEDKNSARYAQPVTYQYRTRPVGQVDTQAAPADWVDVHWSRVQILAEGSVGDMFDGVPLLRAGFNNLVDIEKLSGAGAESAIKNSARTIVVKFGDNANPLAVTQNADGTESGRPVREVIEEQARRMNSNQDSTMLLQGAEATTLQTVVSDLSPQFGIAANLFSASIRIPSTILFGQQTGRLASDEDKADFGARCASRQANDLTPMLEELVRRMQACGIFDQGDFEIEWPAVNAPSELDKLTNLGKATAAMYQGFQAGLTEPLFDSNELRAMVGFEPRADDGMPDEADLAAAAKEEAALAQAAAQPKAAAK